MRLLECRLFAETQLSRATTRVLCRAKAEQKEKPVRQTQEIYAVLRALPWTWLLGIRSTVCVGRGVSFIGVRVRGAAWATLLKCPTYKNPIISISQIIKSRTKYGIIIAYYLFFVFWVETMYRVSRYPVIDARNNRGNFVPVVLCLYH